MADTACHNYTDTDFNVIFTTKLVVSSLAVCSCLLAILVITVSRGYRRFVYRLVLYFMTVVMCQAISLILEQIPIIHRADYLVTVRDGWDIPCSVFAFIDQVAHWMGNFVVLWIFLYLLRLVWRLYQFKIPSNDSQKVTRAEVVALFVTFTCPLVFNWVPFAVDMYGLSGLWCWIKMTENGCGGDQTLGLTLIFLMFYGPLMFLMVFGLVSLLIIVAALCRRWSTVQGMIRRQYTKGIKEIALVMLYPVLYLLICVLLVTNRIDSAVRTRYGAQPYYPLWLAHALADSFRTLLPPLAFLLHPSTWTNLLCVAKREEDTEYYIVPPEDSDIEEGITIRGTQQNNYGSVLL